MKIFCFLSLCILFIQQGNAKTYHVGEGYAFSSIKPAIEMAQSMDSIVVHGGIYTEGNIIVDKPLFIIGENWPVLDGEKKYEVLSIKANHVFISGFKIQFSGHASLNDPCGIKVYDSQYVHIIDNELADNFFGIYLLGKNGFNDRIIFSVCRLNVKLNGIFGFNLILYPCIPDG